MKSRHESPTAPQQGNKAKKLPRVVMAVVVEAVNDDSNEHRS